MAPLTDASLIAMHEWCYAGGRVSGRHRGSSVAPLTDASLVAMRE